ncbi:hypothetical protein HIM_03548 [Hirsutella minnesotensis 3608]|uniref:Phospholipid/glycerol acyltransferase domain-containing protein n=1 Tax=Hirsutella minnesotensis 3608 TaxID=1043627 RepID=A0A0F8A2S2_9HYPO|nr:hypothetical protein HIM_03548 [Hirsutella minnesotensis 3608]
MAELKHPDPSETDIPSATLSPGFKHQKATMRQQETTPHPSGKEGYGIINQALRVLAFSTYFFTCCIGIIIAQTVGVPLYFINRDWFYAYMSMTKRSFALTTTVMTHIWGPTTMRISGDESVAGQIRPTRGGGVEFKFPERLVMVANHQIYTDWLYLWWIGYVNSPAMHGHVYIILKESLKYIPFIGTGMMLYGFIFMSRKMATDRPRLAHRLNKLTKKKVDPRGRTYLDPMWLLLFPEGTNLSANGRTKSAQWADKNGLKDPEHVLLPRSTGTFFCLNELKGTVDYVYDCTVAYEGVPRGKYGEQLFGLASTYFQGRPPKSVNLYWRRFRVADIPLDDAQEFDAWLREQWYKKDELMEEYINTGRFPAMVSGERDYVETSVKTRNPLEILQVFNVTGVVAMIWYNMRRFMASSS